MLISLIFISFFVFCFIVFIKTSYDNDWFIGAAVLFVLASVFFVVTVFNLLINPDHKRAEIAEFEAVKQTVADQRNHTLPVLERVQLANVIIDQNRWLAREQCWAKTLWFNWFYPEEIHNIKPIK